MVLDEEAITQLEELLPKIVKPVELVAALDDSAQSDNMRAVLTQVAGLSELISFSEASDARTPSFAIVRPGTDISVRFAGLPMGKEFASFVLALLQVGGHPVRADEDVIAAVTGITKPHEFVSYISLSCPNCPTVVQTLNAMSILNPLIKHTVVEGSTFRSEIEELNIQAVPSVYLDGEFFSQGRMDFRDILDKLEPLTDEQRAARLAAVEPFDVLVLGGGPAGASAAVYAARRGLRVGMATANIGGQVLESSAFDNLIIVPRISGAELGKQFDQALRKYGVEIYTGLYASKLHPKPVQSPEETFTVDFAGGGNMKARAIVIATGACYRTTGIPGEAEYRNHGVSFCPQCDGPLFSDKPVAVIGGGNAAIEAAIELAEITSHVTVLEMMPQLKADIVLIDKFNSLANTKVVTSAKPVAVTGDKRGVTSLRYRDARGSEHDIAINAMFVQIGQVPNTAWLGDVVETKWGQIVVNERNATSLPGVFAAGDVTLIPFKQVPVALGAGATAALGAADYLIRG